jgi:uncharacterized protein (DUF4415 family)
MSKIVRKSMDDYKPSSREIRRMAALAARPDSEIDLSDIPELGGDAWKHPRPNPFYRPVKKQLTVRLDADVIAWLRKQGKGYQTRLNGLLRAAMLREAAPKRRRAG